MRIDVLNFCFTFAGLIGGTDNLVQLGSSDGKYRDIEGYIGRLG